MVFIMFLIVLVFLPTAILLLINYLPYSDSEYRRETGYSFFKVFFDLGLRGEYLTVSKLSKIKGYHKILVNVYLPKEDNKTTEIDAIYLHESGVYVIESKNYSGWILGKEEDRNWMQIMGKQRKSFYNPIKQNEGHIKYLLRQVPGLSSNVVQSLIVFSERCTLKKIEVRNPHVSVFNRNRIGKYIKNNPTLSRENIDAIYTQLKRFSKAPANVKQLHIENVRKNK